jgi:hypothetical protein
MRTQCTVVGHVVVVTVIDAVAAEINGVQVARAAVAIRQY